MVAITLRMPVDVVDDLKDVAPVLGFSGYQPLIRFYVGRGLRDDLERLENPDPEALMAALRRQGIDESVLSKAVVDARKRGGS